MMKKHLWLALLVCQLVWGQTTVVVHGNQKVASSVIITFTASVTSAVTYNLKRSEIQGGPYGTIGTGQSCCSIQDQNVRKSHTYYYVVTATDGVTESDNSNETSVVIP